MLMSTGGNCGCPEFYSDNPGDRSGRDQRAGRLPGDLQGMAYCHRGRYCPGSSQRPEDPDPVQGSGSGPGDCGFTCIYHHDREDHRMPAAAGCHCDPSGSGDHGITIDLDTAGHTFPY